MTINNVPVYSSQYSGDAQALAAAIEKASQPGEATHMFTFETNIGQAIWKPMVIRGLTPMDESELVGYFVYDWQCGLDK